MKSGQRFSFKKRNSGTKKERVFSEKIFVNGYRFVIASQSATTIYLKCANFRSNCKARASKRKNSNEVFVTKSEHRNCIPGEFDDDVMSPFYQQPNDSDLNIGHLTIDSPVMK